MDKLPNSVLIDTAYESGETRFRNRVTLIGATSVMVAGLITITFTFLFASILLPIVGFTAGVLSVIAVCYVGSLAYNSYQRRCTEANTYQIQHQTQCDLWQALVDKEQAIADQERIKAEHLDLHKWMLTVPDNHFAISAKDGSLISSPNRPIRDQEALATLPAETELEPLSVIDILEAEDCLMITGGRGGGKTNLMMRFAAMKHSRTIACDPKGLAINPWPGCAVASEPGEITAAVSEVHSEMLSRRKASDVELGAIYLCLDELHYLVDDLDLDIMGKVFSIVTLGREYNIHASFTTSDSGVKSLGIEGRSGLKDGLTWIALHRDRTTGDREAWLIESRLGQRERVRLALPGRFVPAGTGYQYSGTAAVEGAILNGMSANEIFKRYYTGTGRGDALKEIKAIKERVLGQYQGSTSDSTR